MRRDLSALAASLPDLWQGRRLKRDVPVMATGHPALDRQLPSGGWPLGALTELLSDAPGSGELSLLLPALAEATSKSQWVVLVDPPWVPYPPALYGHGVVLEQVLLVRTRNATEALWACEQALRGVLGGAVLAWPVNPQFSRLRRLQLAAHTGRKAAFLFRPSAAASQASPAALRLHLAADAHGSRVTVLKCRGRRPEAPVWIRRSPCLPGMATPPQDQPGASVPLACLAGHEPQAHEIHAYENEEPARAPVARPAISAAGAGPGQP
jgi:hypothetical protein